MGWTMIHEFIAALKPVSLRSSTTWRGSRPFFTSSTPAWLSYRPEERASMQRIFTPEAMLAEGWSKDVVIDVDDRGGIAAVRARQGPGAAGTAGGPGIPGVGNVPSHPVPPALARRA